MTEAFCRSIVRGLLFTLALGSAMPATSADSCACADTARVPGILQFDSSSDSPAITTPERARVGDYAQMRIDTFGSGCERAGNESVVVTATGASVWVYDFTTAIRPDVVCTTVLKRLPHFVNIRFDEPGDKVVRIWGRRAGAGANPSTGEPVVVTRVITVSQ